MKNSIYSIIPLLVITPAFVFAHGTMMDFDEAGTQTEMMRYIADRAMGDETHEELEALMTKMMTGDLSQEEADRMVALMDQYPGPYGMMMGHMFAQQNGKQPYGYDTMMGNYGMGPWGGHMYGYGGGWSLLMPLSSLVWLIAGLFLIAVLVKKMMKK